MKAPQGRVQSLAPASNAVSVASGSRGVSSRMSADALAENFTKALSKVQAAPAPDPLDNTYLGWGWHEDAIFGQRSGEQIAA